MNTDTEPYGVLDLGVLGVYTEEIRKVGEPGQEQSPCSWPGSRQEPKGSNHYKLAVRMRLWSPRP